MMICESISARSSRCPSSVNATGTEVSFTASAPGPVEQVLEPGSAVVFGLLGGACTLAFRRRPR